MKPYFGYRKGRSTKDALRKIWKEVQEGREWILDADLKGFFGSVDHEKLMTLVNQCVSDGRVLRLIESILKAGCYAEGKRIPTEQGTPQGGVISPLLANIYLNVLDTLWVVKRVEERLGARLVRYADDCVILCRGNTDRILNGVRRVFDNLHLKLNEEKTRVVDARRESFNFLGFTIGMKRGRKTGKMYSHIEPS